MARFKVARGLGQGHTWSGSMSYVASVKGIRCHDQGSAK